MATVPVVLSQVQTYEDSRPVLMRQKDVTTNGVKLRMQSDSVATNVASDHEEELMFSPIVGARVPKRQNKCKNLGLEGSSGLTPAATIGAGRVIGMTKLCHALADDFFELSNMFTLLM